MAEVGLVASLLGIASFGIQLTTTLYNFGSTASAAQQQTDYIARHVSLYAEVLELLAQRIDEDEPIHSRKAVDLVERIYDESYDLFESIQDLLPDRSEKFSFMQKIKWNFKKTKVDVLVSEINYLRSTVNLLVNVLYAGKTLRTYRRKKRSKKAEEDVKLQFAKAQNAIVEQMNATSSKEDLVAAAGKDEQNEEKAESGAEHEQLSTALTKTGYQIPNLVNNAAMVRFKNSLIQAKTTSEERSLVMQNSIGLLTDLLEQWTTLPEEVAETDLDEAKHPISTPVPEILAGSGTAGRSPDRRGLSNDTEPRRSMEPQNEVDLGDRYTQSQNRVKELEAELWRLKTDNSKAEANTVPDPYLGYHPGGWDYKSSEMDNISPARQERQQSPSVPSQPAAAKSMLESLGILPTVNNYPTPSTTSDKPKLNSVEEFFLKFRKDLNKPPLGPVSESFRFPKPTPGATKTKLSRRWVNLEALERTHEEFHYDDEYIHVHRVLSAEEILQLKEETRRIRGEGRQSSLWYEKS